MVINPAPFPLFRVVKAIHLSSVRYLHYKYVSSSITPSYKYSFSNVFVLRTVSIGRTSASICSRLFSKNGGNDNFSPSVSYGSSPINPGPSVAHSNKIPGATRAYNDLKKKRSTNPDVWKLNVSNCFCQASNAARSSTRNAIW